MIEMLHWIIRPSGRKSSWIGGMLLGMLLPSFGFAFAPERLALVHGNDLWCLTQNIYHEARGEPVEGQLAVGIVTLNRVQSSRYPDDVCEVVHERKQFSWTSLPSNARQITDPRAWYQALSLAERVLEGNYNAADYQLAGVMHYHNHTVRPQWASTGELVTAIGRHRFYLL